MLISFELENYKSFKGREGIDFRRVSRLREKGYNLEAPKGAAILPSIAIYGANASGKSNLLSGMAHLCAAVEFSAEGPASRKIPYHPYKLTNSVKSTSSFKIQFFYNGNEYQFSFSQDGDRFIDECLKEKGERAWRTLYKRTDSNDYKFGKNLGGRNSIISELTRPNSLFISVAAKHNHPKLLDISLFLSEKILFDRNESQWPTTAQFMTDPSLGVSKEDILKFMKAADFGIEDIKVKTEKFKPEDIERINRILLAMGEESDPSMFGEDNDFLENHHKYTESFLLRGEGGKVFQLPLSKQSTGTQKFWHLAGGIIHTLKHGGTIIVDEIEASLHPIVAREIVKLFNDRNYNIGNGQIVFSSHSVTLLSDSYTSRSSVWFTYKDEEGHSEVYPLSDFNTRARDDIGKSYLQGRYGGLPFIDYFAWGNDEEE